MALQNDLQKTKLKNELKVKATEESAIREQGLKCFCLLNIFQRL